MRTSIELGVALLGFALVGPPTAARAQEAQDNVVIVLDASGSMGGQMAGSRVSKMDAAKTALKEVLRQLPESTQVGLLVFSGRNVNNEWVYPLGPRRDAELLQAIDRPLPDGGTPLGAYIKKGADRLLEVRAQQFGYGTFRLLVVTDGEANDASLVERYTPEVIARGITVDVIGVNMEQDHTLATRVHSYRRANDPESLRRAVADVFAEVAQPRTDVAGEDAFSLIASIPTETAAAAIQALAVSGNEPIGKGPALQPTRSRAAASAPATPSQAPAPAPQRGRRFPSLLLIIFFVVVALSVLRGAARSAGRGRR